MTTNLLDLFNAHCNTRIDAAMRGHHETCANHLIEIRDSLEPLIKKMVEPNPVPVGDVDAAAKAAFNAANPDAVFKTTDKHPAWKLIATAALTAGYPQLVAERDALKADFGIVNHYFPEGINNVKGVIAENATLKKRVEELESVIRQHHKSMDHAFISAEVTNANLTLWETLNQQSGEAMPSIVITADQCLEISDISIPEPDEDPKETSPHPLTVDGKTPGQVLQESIAQASKALGLDDVKPWGQNSHVQQKAYAHAENSLLAALAPKVKIAPSVDEIESVFSSELSRTGKAFRMLEMLAGTFWDKSAHARLTMANAQLEKARKELRESTDKIQALSLQLEEAQEKLAESKLDSERLDWLIRNVSMTYNPMPVNTREQIDTAKGAK